MCVGAVHEIDTTELLKADITPSPPPLKWGSIREGFWLYFFKPPPPTLTPQLDWKNLQEHYCLWHTKLLGFQVLVLPSREEWLLSRKTVPPGDFLSNAKPETGWGGIGGFVLFFAPLRQTLDLVTFPSIRNLYHPPTVWFWLASLSVHLVLYF